ncbi:SDR family oxidoreductase [Aquirhabdus sp.]|uniref:SDR family oxidoreductase n=1 Tax=Aquirhabdus sp. TaxID=2824160 RepID=UPI00396CE18F
MNNVIKTAIVTGASRGIGREIALRLAQDGFAVAINYAGNQASADNVVSDIQQNGGKAIAIQGNVADQQDMVHLFSETKRIFGRIDVVVNSAGVMANTPIIDGNLAQFDKMISTNLRGAFIVMSAAAQHIETGGRIIALTTSVIGASLPTYGPYIASKVGVEGLVRVLANELRGRNISVNSIAPGPVATELFFTGKSDELIQKLSHAAPLERLGTPQDIAHVVSFLAGPEGAWINAQIIRANGGFV